MKWIRLRVPEVGLHFNKTDLIDGYKASSGFDILRCKTGWNLVRNKKINLFFIITTLK